MKSRRVLLPFVLAFLVLLPVCMVYHESIRAYDEHGQVVYSEERYGFPWSDTPRRELTKYRETHGYARVEIVYHEALGLHRVTFAAWGGG